jgi:hypothetical protein
LRNAFSPWIMKVGACPGLNRGFHDATGPKSLPRGVFYERFRSCAANMLALGARQAHHEQENARLMTFMYIARTPS